MHKFIVFLNDFFLPILSYLFYFIFDDIGIVKFVGVIIIIISIILYIKYGIKSTISLNNLSYIGIIFCLIWFLLSMYINKPLSNPDDGNIVIIGELNNPIYYDHKHKLYWDKCSLGQNYESGNCSGKAETYNWQEANRMVKYLNDSRYLGYNNWRLPHIQELYGLLACSNGFEKTKTIPAKNQDKQNYITKQEKFVKGFIDVGSQCKKYGANPLIDTAIYSNTQSSVYWSSVQAVVPYEGQIWGVNFQKGIVSPYQSKNKFFIRVVRSD